VNKVVYNDKTEYHLVEEFVRNGAVQQYAQIL